MALVLNGSGITSANIADGTIVNADINSSAAIDGSKLTGAGKVLQVVQGTASGIIYNSTTTPVDILNASITPSATTSKIVIITSCDHTASTGHNDSQLLLSINRGATNIFEQKSAWTNANTYNQGNVSLNYLDSPATTSAISYNVKMASMISGVNVNVNNDRSIILMEIGA